MAEQHGTKKRPRVNVHGLDSKDDLWLAFRGEALRQRNIPTGQLLHAVLTYYLQLSEAERSRITERWRATLPDD